MNIISPIFLGASLLIPNFCHADNPEKYLGLNEFRHVRADLTTIGCGSFAWEDGNYFENTSANRLFAPNEDTLTVKLKGAYFAFAPESSKWRPWVNKLEVQVGIFADISFKGSTANAPGVGGIPGRLVFYSDNYFVAQRRIPDVNTNIYGPVLYPGGGLAIKLTTLEFDQEKDDQLKDTLLKSVAELGTNASVGIPSYLQGPLTSLFQSALSAAKSKDDMFGQITFVLDDRNAADNSPTAPLRAGDIVVIRQTRRSNAIDWKNLCYDPRTAEVFVRSKKGENSKNTPVTTSDVNSVSGLSHVNAVTKVSNVTGERRIDEEDYLPPELNYIAISLLKNAGADAGKIQDALTYERLIVDLQQRKSDAGIISSVAAVTTALNERATDRELMRKIDVLGQKPGTISELEKSDAANLVSRVLYASLLAFNGFDYAKMTDPKNCLFLSQERVKNEWLTRIFARLRTINSTSYTREKFNSFATSAPMDCVEANKKLQAVYQELMSPT